MFFNNIFLTCPISYYNERDVFQFAFVYSFMDILIRRIGFSWEEVNIFEGGSVFSFT